MKLTDVQIQDYRDNGYLVLGHLLSEAEADRMAEVYLDCLHNFESNDPSQRVSDVSRTREVDPETGIKPENWQLRCAHVMHPGFDAIMRDEGLLDAIESLIGPNIQLIVCQGLYKPPHTGGIVRWHQDNRYFEVDKADTVVSCWLTFDDATVDNGCMWVIPGAHRQPLHHDDLPDVEGYYIPDVDESQAIPIELKRGECMLHHGLMPHRTLPNATSSHRRALALHYMDAHARPSDVRQQEPSVNLPVVRGVGSF